MSINKVNTINLNKAVAIFKEGDVVCLKSGGPAMVIGDVLPQKNNTFHYEVYWCDKGHAPYMDTLKEVMLRTY